MAGLLPTRMKTCPMGQQLDVQNEVGTAQLCGPEVVVGAVVLPSERSSLGFLSKLLIAILRSW